MQYAYLQVILEVSLIEVSDRSFEPEGRRTSAPFAELASKPEARM